MNWHYGDPIINGKYLCCIIGNRYPVVIYWYNGEWGNWHMGSRKEWFPLDDEQVLCYIGFDEIPMPENW